MLRQLAVSAHQANDNAFTFGLLAGRDQVTTDEINTAWQRLRTRRTRSWLRR